MGEKVKALLSDPKIKARIAQLRAQQNNAANVAYLKQFPPVPQAQFPKRLEVEWDDSGKLQSFSINGESVAIQRNSAGRITSARVGEQELVPTYNPDGVMDSLNVGGMSFDIKRTKQGLAQEIGNGCLVFSINRDEKGRMTDVTGRVVNQ